MKKRMPLSGAVVMSRAHVFLANDTTEQALEDLELIEAIGRYNLRSRAQKTKGCAKIRSSAIWQNTDQQASEREVSSEGEGSLTRRQSEVADLSRSRSMPMTGNFIACIE